MARADGKNRGLFERPAGSGVWWVLYYDHLGQRHREKVGPKSLARQVYEQRKTEIRMLKFDPERIQRRKVWTVERMMTHFRALRAADRVNGPRNQSEDARYAQYWIDQFGGYELDQLQSKHLTKWRIQRSAEVKPATVNRAVTYLKAYFNLAVRDGYCKTNPAAALEALKENNERSRFLQYAEEDRLRAEGGLSEEETDIVACAIRSGMRQSEQFKLAWAQVDLAARTIEVLESKHGSRRFVTIGKSLLEILERQRERHPGSRWVFPAPGKPKVARVGRNFATRTFDPACERAGIDDFTWHDLRHTYGSRLAMKGVPLRTIQLLMGHKSIRMTERYAHLCPGTLKDAADLLA